MGRVNNRLLLLFACLVLHVSLQCHFSAAGSDVMNQIITSLRSPFAEESDSFQVSLNTSVSIVVSGFLDRLRCTQQGLTPLECVQCLTPKKILSMLSTSATATTRIFDLEHLSVLLLNHAVTFREVCKRTSESDFPTIEGCKTYIECRDQLLTRFNEFSSGNSSLLDPVEDFLREIKAFYEPLPGQTCFSAENLLEELNISDPQQKTNELWVEHLSTLLLSHLLTGECIDVGESVTDFLEDLFLHYGDRCSQVITKTGFEKLLSDLKNPDDENYVSRINAMKVKNCDFAIYNLNGQEASKKHFYKNGAIDKLLETSSNNADMHNTGSSNKGSFAVTKEIGLKSSSVYNTYTTSAEGLQQNETVTRYMYKTDVLGHDFKTREKRSTRQNINDHIHRSLANECLTADNLLQKFALSPQQSITRTEFLWLCPALIQQVVSGVCESNETKQELLPEPSSEELYGYSTLSVFIISLCALCGIFVMPLMAKNAYKYVMMGFIGLSFGTMAGDAILHLIPQALGLHSHDEKVVENDIGVTMETIPTYIWRQLGVIGAIYGLFIFEMMIAVIHGNHEDSHGHSHVPDKLPETMKMKQLFTKTESQMQLAGMQTPTSVDIDTPSTPKELVVHSTSLFWGFTSLAVMITLGDTIHNFGDGLAIGAAFSSGLRGGLSTSLAVFCHELPHEFGDFVVLLSTGLSFWKALIVNFLSALFAFIGLYIGIHLGENVDARQWILTVTAGIFLYVALAEMLPELKQDKGGSPVKMLIVKNLGVLIGIGIMIVIAIYEDHFHI